MVKFVKHFKSSFYFTALLECRPGKRVDDGIDTGGLVVSICNPSCSDMSCDLEAATCRVLSRRYNSLENLAVLKLNVMREEAERWRQEEEGETKKETLQTTTGEQEANSN